MSRTSSRSMTRPPLNGVDVDLLADEIRELELRLAASEQGHRQAVSELAGFRARRMVAWAARLGDQVVPWLRRIGYGVDGPEPAAGGPALPEQPLDPPRSALAEQVTAPPPLSTAAELTAGWSDQTVSQQRDSLVSVIMPTYNRGPLIGEAMDSVLAQTHDAWELIIIDDGSTDDTADVVARLASRCDRIRLVRTDHGGPARARNRGLELATGRFCAYLDSDNTWTPRFLETMVGMLIETGHNCGYAALARQIKGETVEIVSAPFDWDRCRTSNLVDLNVLVHRSDLLEARFDESLGRNEDWDLVLRIGRHHDILHVPMLGCHYRADEAADRVSVSGLNLFTKVVSARHRSQPSSAPSTLQTLSTLALDVTIRVAAPFDDRCHWGDSHLAKALARSFGRRGHRATIRYRDSTLPAPPADVNLVLRGAVPFTPEPGAVNVLWVICDPEQVEPAELEAFDLVFVASHSYAALLNCSMDPAVEVLLQASGFSSTDGGQPSNRLPVSRGQAEAAIDGRILFVGNSRADHRPLVEMAVRAGLDPVVIGTGWSDTTVAPYTLDRFVDNAMLPDLYRRAGWVLNDHWPSMLDFGIISNRLFDIVASGGRAISDRLDEITAELPTVAQVESVDDLSDLVSANHPRPPDGGEPEPRTTRPPHVDDRVAVLLKRVARHVARPFADDCPGEARPVDPWLQRRHVLVVSPGWSDAARGKHHQMFRLLLAPLTSGVAGQLMQAIPQAELAPDVELGSDTILVALDDQADLDHIGITPPWLGRDYMIMTWGDESVADQAVARWGQPLRRWQLTDEIGSGITTTIDPRLWRRYVRRGDPPPGRRRPARIIVLDGLAEGRLPLVVETTGTSDVRRYQWDTSEPLDHYRLARLVRAAGPFDIALCGTSVGSVTDCSDRLYEVLVGQALGAVVVVEPAVAETLPLGQLDVTVMDEASRFKSVVGHWPDLLEAVPADNRFPDDSFWRRFGTRSLGRWLVRQWPEQLPPGSHVPAGNAGVSIR